jgi:amino acid adenylation domain-containing protein
MSEIDLTTRRAKLSPAKRALLEKRLTGQDVGLVESKSVPRRQVRSYAPLSFAQQRLWFLHQVEPDSIAYNMPTALRLTGRLNTDALEWGINEIIRRHESLRTTFRLVDNQPVQIIAEQLTLKMPIVELQNFPAEEREAMVMQLAAEEVQRLFDIETGPLVRARLLRLNAEECVLLFTMHHIISDGWSMGVLVNEMAALYRSYIDAQPSPLTELPVQYADFAEWQREWLTKENLERQLQYWKQQLGSELPVLELPTDSVRPPRQSFRGAVRRFALSEELSAAIKSLGRQESATLFMTLLAAFQSLLHRYTNQTDILVGTAIANRNRAEIEGLIGFFVNTLVLRTDFSGHPTFRELLRRIRDLTLGAYAHQDLPFERIVEELQPARDLSRNPIFQVSFNLQNAPIQELELPGLTIRTQEFESLTTRFDLECHMWDMAGGLQGFLFFSTDLFEEATIERLLAHYRKFLEEVVANPDQRVSEIQFLTEDERHKLLFEWNDTQHPITRDICIHHLFEAQAAKMPSALAVEFAGEQLTYAELNERANQLARYLRGLGVGPESLVGICIERSNEMLIGLLAILKAGGAYVPLDLAYPPQRLSFMIKDARPSVVLTKQGWLQRLPESEAQIVCVDAITELLEQASPENLHATVTSENVAYVIYTSGSTGIPKGVAVPHRAVIRLVRETYYIRFAADEVFLQLAPVSFDASTLEIWGSLLNGARLVIMPPQTPSLAELGAALRDYDVTTLWLTAGLFHLMVDERLEDLGGVRQLLAGGDVLSAAHVQRYLAATDNGVLINGYGPTENTTFSCTHRMAAGWELRGSSVPIGRPIKNTQVYVLDQRMEPAPIGVAGELYLGGAGLAREYLRRPELTAEKFVPHPYSAEAGARLYHTGDQVRWLADGTLEFVGRVDQQVKVRGFRIELGEIEAALGEQEEVKEAVVITREESGGEKRLVAYVVPRTEVQSMHQERVQLISRLRVHLEEKLPDYMIPASFVLLDALPLTPNHKVDRRALPAPDEARPEQAGEFVAPSTPIEELLSRLWAEVLRVESVGVHDDFFTLGGHSLLATRLVSRVRESFGVELPVRSLFETPTVRDLAGHVEAALRDRVGEQSPPIIRVSRDERLPLSFAQQRLWFLHELEPTSSFYNVPVAVRLRGRLQIDAMQRTLNEIVRRHESLRTSFPTIDAQPVQSIAPTLALDLSLIDLSTLREEEREHEVQRRATEEARAPFNLATGPLVRASLVRLGAEDHALLVTMHHIVSDGWSMGVLIKEVGVLYRAFIDNEPSPLPELPVQYADFAVWQRRWLAGEVFETHLRYWRRQLGGELPVLNLPTDKPRPEVQSFRGSSESLQLPMSLLQEINALSKREGVTLFMLLLAAFKALLSRYTEQSDIVIGSPIANRNRVELEGLIGFFVNTLTLRTDLSGNPTFHELARRVRTVALEAYAHQDMPFEQLVEQMQPERTMSRNPLFQVMFQMENTPKEELPLPGLVLSPVEVERVTTQFDLSFDVMENDEGLMVIAEYSTDLFNKATISSMLRRWQILLEEVVTNPDARLNELPLLTGAEREQLLRGCNETRKAFAAERSLPELFESQVAARPSALAVVSDQEQLTFAELNRRANRLAHLLAARGMGPESLVGLCMERSAQMIVALLGILKTGAAYLPLDPSLPRERLAFMLEDARVPVLLTEEQLSTRLPDHGAEMIYLDRQREAIANGDEANLVQTGTAENLAYVIYTSGSTGRPKGVAISHQSLVNHGLAVSAAYGLTTNDRILQFASISFDVAAEEIFSTLLSGASILLPSEKVIDSVELLRLIEDEKLSVLNLPAPFWHAWVRELAATGRRVPPCLRLLVVGSEKVSLEAFDAWRRFAPGARLINAYGTSETTITSTLYEPEGSAPAAGIGASLPIGRPIANTRVYILDHHLQPVPAGVPGELYIAGIGLARGYLMRPELTAERFIPDPFSLEAGARMYRTGDRARFLSDGQIEFLGRSDQQLKVRGYRIEPGEIEFALKRHLAVREALVLARQDSSGDKRLVAYVTQNAEISKPLDKEVELEEEQLAQWQIVHDDEVFNQTAPLAEPTFNISGWNSSYTGEPIAAEEMREWVDDAVERILSLAPNRALEIGCGTGLLLFRLAQYCETYTGTDFSPAALSYVRQQLAVRGGMDGEVMLLERRADDFRDIEPNSFDAVILNSVVQYFPSVAYLLRVLEGAVSATRSGGFVFVGDVRSLPLLEAFHTSVELAKADDALSLEELRQIIRKRVADEEELILDPAFFVALKEHLPQISHVDILPKRARLQNEMTRFRYQVILHIGEQTAPAAAPAWIDYQHVANARTSDAVRALAMLERLEAQPSENPANVGELKEILRQSEEKDPDPQFEISRRKAWNEYANNPLQGKFARHLIPQLRNTLEEQLPDYMMPSSFVVLDEWPLTPGGKIDLHALPAPDSARSQGQGALVAPRTPVEQTLASIWSELLGRARVGIHDNFFESGGHSLLATQLISRVREKFHVEIGLRLLFERPTIELFATAIEEAQRESGAPQIPEIVPIARQAHRMKRAALRRPSR